jgi:hypothetical protein
LQAAAEGSNWVEVGQSDRDVKFARADKRALAVILKKNSMLIEVRVCDIDFVEMLAAPRGN